MSRPAYLLSLGPTPYAEAWELQRSLAAAVLQAAIPDTVVLPEHPPVVTVGRPTGEGEVHVPGWVTTHGYALNVDLEPGPFTSWITACGLEDAAFTTMGRELRSTLSVDEVRPAAAAALEEVFDLALDELPADEGHGLWSQP